MSIKELKRHWQVIWKELEAKDAPDKYWDELINQYCRPKRYYHTFEDHIADGFEELLLFLKEVPPALGFAWLYHDAILNREGTSEQLSAELALSVRRKAQMSDGLDPLIATPILATRHNGTPMDFSSRVLVDVDLSVFGKPGKIFDQYEENIRNEFSDVPFEIFARERAKILQHFLDRESIYCNSYFITRYESRARKNLSKSIKKLNQTEC